MRPHGFAKVSLLGHAVPTRCAIMPRLCLDGKKCIGRVCFSDRVGNQARLFAFYAIFAPLLVRLSFGLRPHTFA